MNVTSPTAEINNDDDISVRGLSSCRRRCRRGRSTYHWLSLQLTRVHDTASDSGVRQRPMLEMVLLAIAARQLWRIEMVERIY